MKLPALLGVLLLAACDTSPAPAQNTAAPATALTAPSAIAATAPSNPVSPPPASEGKNLMIWDTPLKTLSGNPTTLANYKGKALLVVNVASKCGLTPQYGALEELQKKYEAKGFSVIGFPSNQFSGQEPGSAEEIQEFCSTTYGVTFPMMEKIEVNGANQNPVYAELTKVPVVGGAAGDISWNFEKFVISADGSKITRFAPKTKPDAPEVVAAIEASLPKS